VGIKQRFVLLSREGKSLVLLGRYVLDSLCRIFFDPSLSNAKVKKCDEAMRLVVLRGGSTGPEKNPATERWYIELR